MSTAAQAAAPDPAGSPATHAAPAPARNPVTQAAHTAPDGVVESVAFAAADSGTGGLTWGQRAIWDAVRKTVPDDHYFNFGRVLPVPGRRTVAEVLEAVAGLTALHGALRTRLDLSGPEPRQRLEAAGTLPVLVTEENPESVLERLNAERFDYESQWPVRVALVRSGDRVTHVVLGFCHLAADGLGSEIAVRDLRMLLLRGGRLARPAPPRPLDLAAWQESAEGRRVARRAAELWEAVPHGVMFERAVGAAEDPPIWRARLASPALDLASRALAAAHRTSTSTVLLAATAVLVARATDQDRCTVLPIVNNRFRPDVSRLVSTLSQEGVFSLDGVDRPLPQLLRGADAAAMRAYRSAFHDPRDRAEGSWVQPLACFNDMRFADPGPSSYAPAEIEAALAATELSWPLRQSKLNCRFCVHVSTSTTGTLEFSVTADTGFFSRADIERGLTELERSLVTEATGTRQVRFETMT
ncbi:condensation domain-containing protein [Streptacidiphilus jiangxiensis]|uniref:Condensation domain-containing protein n=1 Tax=Streptacidiphilus jiangxiensis TaxID=235985 RepID=A0A1H7G661_STRJI|nr:condensation domain-containing protein [Streptacidiphilus jiangxiensis]SEK31235.1 Condensation domain-containing protein [Streptacidiphilus jiangxiensis]